MADSFTHTRKIKNTLTGNNVMSSKHDHQFCIWEHSFENGVSTDTPKGVGVCNYTWSNKPVVVITGSTDWDKTKENNIKRKMLMRPQSSE